MPTRARTVAMTTTGKSPSDQFSSSAQSCPTLRLYRQQATRLHRPWDSPGKNAGVGCHCLLQCVKVKSESEVAQSCLTLRDPMDCSPPGSSVHRIFQTRVLEWVAIAFSEPITLHGYKSYPHLWSQRRVRSGNVQEISNCSCH